METFKTDWPFLIPLIILVAAIWRSLQEDKAKGAIEETELQIQRERTAQNNPNGTSADFSALIHAIKAEGHAYRKEERTEDISKKFREWITIFLLGLTCYVIKCQVDEMVKVYDPIKTQADATVTAQRAWLAPLVASFNTALSAAISPDVTVQIQNTGREPHESPHFW